MDTVSLLVSRHALVGSRSTPLVGLLLLVGLTLLVVAGLGLDHAVPPLSPDVELAPFRWNILRSDLA